MQRWQKRPEGSTWGDFGPDDEIGRLNLLTPEKVLQGVAEVREGKTFCLSLPLDLPGGNAMNARRHPPRLAATTRDGVPYANFPMSKMQENAVDILTDDQVTLCLQYSTQWDGLSHIGAYFDARGDGVPTKRYYNGYEAGVDILGGDDRGSSGEGHSSSVHSGSGHSGSGHSGNGHTGSRPTGSAHSGSVHDHDDHAADGCCNHGASFARRLGIDAYAAKGMQGRGVLVDFTRHFGTGRTLITYDMLQHAMTADKVVVERGDFLVLRTGFSEAIMDMAGEPDHARLEQTGAVLDGTDTALLNWITESGIAALCADNYAVEAYPARKVEGLTSALPLHHHCLFKLGLPLAELWYLRDLAQWLHANGRNRFLLTAPPLRLPGAVGSPVTPIATV